MSEENVQLERGYAEVPAEIAKTRQRRLVAFGDNCYAWIGIGLELPPTNWRGRPNKVRLAAGFAGAKRTLKKGKENGCRSLERSGRTIVCGIQSLGIIWQRINPPSRPL